MSTVNDVVVSKPPPLVVIDLLSGLGYKPVKVHPAQPDWWSLDGSAPKPWEVLLQHDVAEAARKGAPKKDGGWRWPWS